jgi:hypothetical protein
MGDDSIHMVILRIDMGYLVTLALMEGASRVTRNTALLGGRGLHSSLFRLNVSAFCSMGVNLGVV